MVQRPARQGGRRTARGGAEGGRHRSGTRQARRALTALEAEKVALENQKAELTAANESLARDVEEKVDELALLNGTANGLQEQLKEEIAKGDVRVAESGGKLRVDLVDKVLFDSGEAEISKRGEGVLGRVGAVLAQIDDKQIQVSGHTDNQPVVGEKLLAQFPTNWELSARARSTWSGSSPRRPASRRSGWWPAATPIFTRSPATRPPWAARATAASRSC